MNLSNQEENLTLIQKNKAMKTYNRIMELFWLSVGTVIFIAVTYMGITEGFANWAIYYALGAMAFGTFFMRRFMRLRMAKHQAFLEQQQKNNQ
jgi:hypothetical protein